MASARPAGAEIGNYTGPERVDVRGNRKAGRPQRQCTPPDGSSLALAPGNARAAKAGAIAPSLT
jgi:hypothetical protein